MLPFVGELQHDSSGPRDSADLLCCLDVQATWMAAGGSAPEFFTSIVGATIVAPSQDVSSLLCVVHNPPSILSKGNSNCITWYYPSML